MAQAEPMLGRFIGVIDGLPEVRRVAFMDDRTAFALHAGEPPIVRMTFDDPDSPPRVERMTHDIAREAGAPDELWHPRVGPGHPWWIDPPPTGLITPIAIACDGTGNTVLVDRHANALHRFDVDTGSWRNIGDWGAFPGLFAHPAAVAISSGRIFVADTRNHRIQVFDERLSYLGEWGLHVVRPHEDEGHLHYPEGIAVSGDGMLAIVAEPMQDRLQVFGIVRDGDDAGVAEPMFERETIAHFGPHAARDGQLLVTTEPDRPGLIVWDLSRALPIMIGWIAGHGDEFGRFRAPGEVALRIDGPNGVPRVWSFDPAKQRLQVFDLDWSPEKELGFDPFMARYVRGFDVPRVLGRAEARFGGFVLRDDGSMVWHDASDGSLVLSDARLRPLRGIASVHEPGERVRLRPGPDDDTVALLHVDRGVIELIPLDGPGGRERFVVAGLSDGTDQSPANDRPTSYSDLLFVPGGAAREAWLVDRQGNRVVRAAFWTGDGSGDGREAEGIVVVEPDLVLGLVDGEVPAHPRDRIGPGLFHKPSGLALDNLGHLIVIDEGNHRIQFFDMNGEFLDTYGALWYTQAARRGAPGRLGRRETSP